MSRRLVGQVLTAGLLGALAAVGCGPDKTIELRYQKPAQVQVSEGVKRIGIAEFGGQTAEDRKWGEIASDRLASALDAYNRQFNRYELVDRKRLKAIMDERDLQIAISDSASADQAGKLAKVDAMVYGNVNVAARDEQATRTTFDPMARGMKTVPYTKRYVMVAVSFAMDDVSSGKTITTLSRNREYDSESDKSSDAASIGKALGFGGDKLPPRDQIVSRLIEECVQDFIRQISPHEVVASVGLEKGKSKRVETGNKLAAAGDYTEALAVYTRAIAERPDDHGAVFNAGAMHEAMGDLKKAEEFYDRAFQMEPKEEYVMARKRVRLESQE